MSPIPSHYCDTSDGVRVVCLCSTGRDHDEQHFDDPTFGRKDGETR